VTSITLMLGLIAAVGIAAAVVLIPSARSWRAAAEHARAFWLVWILGLTAVGFAAPAGLGLGWLPMAWFTFCVLLGTLQPSMLADLLEVRRYRRLRRRRLRRRHTPVVTAPLIVAARPRPAPVLESTRPPPICWRAPVSSGRPLAGTASRP
jgi:hypothetical protein